MTEVELLEQILIVLEAISASVSSIQVHLVGMLALSWFVLGVTLCIWFFGNSAIGKLWLPALLFVAPSITLAQDYLVIDAVNPPTTSFEHHFSNGTTSFGSTNWSAAFGGSYRAGFPYPETGHYAVKWIFRDLPTGKYRVLASWPHWSTLGTQRFSIIGAGPGVSTDVREIFINAATTAPSGYVINGTNFGVLAENVVHGSGFQLEVLTFDGTPNKAFWADAVAVIRTGDVDLPPDPEEPGGGGGGDPDTDGLTDGQFDVPWTTVSPTVLGSHWTNQPGGVDALFYSAGQGDFYAVEVSAALQDVVFDCGTWTLKINGFVRIANDELETDEIKEFSWLVTVGRNGFAKVWWGQGSSYLGGAVGSLPLLVDPGDCLLVPVIGNLIEQEEQLAKIFIPGEGEDDIIGRPWGYTHHPAYVLKLRNLLVTLFDCIETKTNWGMIIPRCPDATFDPLAGTTVISGGEEVAIPSGDFTEPDLSGLPTGGAGSTSVPGWSKLFGWAPEEEIETTPFMWNINYSAEYLPFNLSLNSEHIGEWLTGETIITIRTILRAAMTVCIGLFFIGCVRNRLAK